MPRGWLAVRASLRLGRVLISGADRRFGCPKLHPQRRLTLLALGVEGGSGGLLRGVMPNSSTREANMKLSLPRISIASCLLALAAGVILPAPAYPREPDDLHSEPV